tara:strand:- start:70 stop:1338 length:1269 start_codon:yes stop_codon:yes gene_type:complete
MKKYLPYFAIFLLFFTPVFAQDDYLYDEVIGKQSKDKSSILDSDFVVREFTIGLSFPTTMAFIEDDILVLQKNDGQVRHILPDGTISSNTILDAKVSNYLERGMLGILVKESSVYLYYTESDHDGGEPIANNIYKYKWTGKTLEEPILIKSLPAYQDAIMHQGGILALGKDNTVYAIIGDQDNQDLARGANVLQNQFAPPDDTGVILPIDPEGPYYAIGIRNSFGLTVDPITGNLWQTENGPDKFDEVNLVMPKFNSGWNSHSGPISESRISHFIVKDPPLANIGGVIKSHLQIFLSSIYGMFVLPDNYVYSDPEFSWEKTVSPTALNFVPTSFGKYENWLFVGDCIGGHIYKFKLNEDRDGFIFGDQSLDDLIFNEGDNIEDILFGEGFGCITDIKFNDGKMYVVSLSSGTIYEIFLDVDK